MKPRNILLICAALVGLSCVIVWYSGGKRPGISLECYESIEEGMTRAQVEAILGGPPRWEVEPNNPGEMLRYLFGRNSHRVFKWGGRNGVITVEFGEAGVARKTFEPLSFDPKPPTLWEVMFPWTRKVRTFQEWGI